MTVVNGVRWVVSAGWLIISLVLERIVTLGGILDLSAVFQNPPEFVATGVGLLIVALAMAILVAADVRRWASLSIAASAAYLLVGIWLRQEENDDSGAAIAATALLIAALAASTLAVRRRDPPGSRPPSG